MIRRFIQCRIAAEEKRLGGSLAPARRIADLSLGAFWRFAMLAPVSTYRRVLPAEARAVARLTVVLQEDCGDCAQIELNQARRDGVPEDLLRAVLNRRLDSLPAPLADVCRFAEALCAGEADAKLRERLERAYSTEQMMELALAIGTAPVYPRVRRAMGLATSCATLEM